MFCGGQGVYLVNLAKALAAAGARVTIMSGPPYPDPVEGTRLVRVPNENFINRLSNDLPKENPLSVFFPLNFFEYVLARTGSNPEALAFSLRCFSEIKKIHQYERVDVVHDNQGLGYGLLLVRSLGIPVMATIHHPLQVDRAEDIMQTEGMMGKMKRAVYYPIVMQKLVAARLDKIITVSGFSKDLVSKTYGLDPAKMSVVPNGIDSAFFKPLTDSPRERGKILFVGSSEDRKKGIIYLLSALTQLPDTYKLVIVDGRRYPGRVYAQNAVSRLGLLGRVTFEDKITNEELLVHYSTSEMMVMPSLFEGFGLPALESMACGLPLITTTAGALPEVADKKISVLVPPRDSKAIIDAVLEIGGKQSTLLQMSERGRDRAVSKFSWDLAAEMVLSQYHEIIREFGNGPADKISV
jgi:MMP alpha-(1->4)-mannosyltransferase